MLSLRSHAIICGSLFAALIGFAILGNALQAMGMPPLSGPARYVAMALFFGLFIAFGLSAIPVMVKLVIAAQVKAGNADAPMIASAIKHQSTIIWSMWSIILLGTVIAIPAAIAGGMFGDEPQRVMNRAMVGKTKGLLAARPDMTLDDLVKRSTLKVDTQYASAAIAGGQAGPFDFTIPGTTLTFQRARYYYITTYSNDHTRLRAVNVGLSPEKQSRADVDAADLALQDRLAADGWLAGHEVYRTEQDQQLHGGATEGPEGRIWMKDTMVLSINRNRMDEEKPGEDKRTAGEWIQYIDLWPAKDYSGVERFVFQPAGARGR